MSKYIPKHTDILFEFSTENEYSLTSPGIILVLTISVVPESIKSFIIAVLAAVTGYMALCKNKEEA